jgi:hypothetical protein
VGVIPAISLPSPSLRVSSTGDTEYPDAYDRLKPKYIRGEET